MRRWLRELRRGPRRPLMTLVAALIALQAGLWSVAADPESLPAWALEWRHPETAAATRHVDEIAERLTPWGQLDYSARLRPRLRVQGYPETDNSDASGRFALAARVDFGDRPATYVRRVQSLESERRQLWQLHTGGIRDALLAHAYLLVAQEQAEQKQRELGRAEEALARAESADGKAGVNASPSAAVSEARLDQRRAKLDQQRADHELNRRRREALAYGFAESVRYRPLRFEAAIAGAAATLASETHEYRIFELELLEAEAELSEVRAGPLDDLRLRGAYRTRTADIDLEGGIVNGRPGATFGLSAPGGPRRWQLEISAEFVLDDSWKQIPRLEQAIEDARASLDSYSRYYPPELTWAVDAVNLAESALALAEEYVSVQELAAAEFNAIQAEKPTPARSSATGIRVERASSSARIRLYRAWIAYIRAVAGLLDLSGGAWDAEVP